MTTPAPTTTTAAPKKGLQAAQANIEVKGSSRRDLLLEIESKAQKKWEDLKINESDAPDSTEPKFLATFPYPYTNGENISHKFFFKPLQENCILVMPSPCQKLNSLLDTNA